jgi:hypothetical protein
MTKQFEALREVHRQRFLAGAQARVDAALARVQGDRAAGAADVLEQLRALAGEASLLGLGSLASVARAGADAARLWVEQGSAAAADVCERSLETLADTISMFTEISSGGFAHEAEELAARRRVRPAG